MPEATYFPGQRLGLTALFNAFRIVARLVAEFGPRIRAAFPEATALLAFLSALEAAADLLIAAELVFDEARDPGGVSDEIDWNDLPGKIVV